MADSQGADPRDRALAGYWRSPWPAEDGGPRRSQAPAGVGGLALGPGDELRATFRSVFAPTMTVLRDPGEVYLLVHTIGSDTVSWVERIDPVSLATLERSPDLAAGPFWPGGLLAHADGDLYATYGRWCHRLSPDCSPEASRQLPRERPYNSLVALGDGHLVMKDIDLDGTAPSQLAVLAPGTLDVVDTLDLPEGSVARLSADGDTVYVVGRDHVFRANWDRSHLVLDDGWTSRYRTVDGQTFAWDTVIEAGAAWFLDDGDGTIGFGGRFRGKGISTVPLRLWRVPLDGAPAESAEVCGRPGGIIANPPVVDPDRRIAVGYDSGNGVMTAWRFGEPGERWESIWDRDQDHAAHMIRYPDTGELVCCDHDESGGEHVVVIDIESGRERGRVATGSPMQSVVFPSVGWDRDLYTMTFVGLTRVWVESGR